MHLAFTESEGRVSLPVLLIFALPSARKLESPRSSFHRPGFDDAIAFLKTLFVQLLTTS